MTTDHATPPLTDLIRRGFWIGPIFEFKDYDNCDSTYACQCGAYHRLCPCDYNPNDPTQHRRSVPNGAYRFKPTDYDHPDIQGTR